MSYTPPAGNAANFVVTGALYTPPAGSAADFRPEYFALATLTLPISFAAAGVHGVRCAVDIEPISVSVTGYVDLAAEAFPEVRLVVSASGFVRAEGGSAFVLPVAVAAQGIANSTGVVNLTMPINVSGAAVSLVHGPAAFSFAPVVSAISRSFGGEAHFSPTFSVAARGLQGAISSVAFTIKPAVAAIGHRYFMASAAIPVNISVTSAGKRGISGTASANVKLTGSVVAKRGASASISVPVQVVVNASAEFRRLYSAVVSATVPMSVYADDVYRGIDYDQVIFTMNRKTEVYSRV